MLNQFTYQTKNGITLSYTMKYNSSVPPIKSYLVWWDEELKAVVSLETSSVQKRLLEFLTLEGYKYAEVKCFSEDRAKIIFSSFYEFLDLEKLKDSEAYVLRESSINIESRFYVS